MKKLPKKKLLAKFVSTIGRDLSWGELCRDYHLDDSFIIKYHNNLVWQVMCSYQKLSENIMRRFSYKLDWYLISINQTLPEGFIRDFADSLDWYEISAHQNLSEAFMREFADRLDWLEISCKSLREEFIVEFLDFIHLDQVIFTNKLSPEFINTHYKIYPIIHEHYRTITVCNRRYYIKTKKIQFLQYDEGWGYICDDKAHFICLSQFTGEYNYQEVVNYFWSSGFNSFPEFMDLVNINGIMTKLIGSQM